MNRKLFSSRERSREFGWLFGATIALSFGSGGQPAEACMNGVVHETSPAERRAITAEQQLEQGLANESLASLKGGGFSDDLAVGSSPLNDRVLALRVRMVARSAGSIAAFKIPGESAVTPEAELREARKIAEKLAVTNAKNPKAASDLGEVLSRIPSERTRAFGVLEDLEKRDVLPSAWGYAALTRLRTEPPATAPSYLAGPLVALGKAPAAMSQDRCLKMAGAHPEICGGKLAASANQQEVATPKAAGTPLGKFAHPGKGVGQPKPRGYRY